VKAEEWGWGSARVLGAILEGIVLVERAAKLTGKAAMALAGTLSQPASAS
jgi:hypothetical protein